MKKSKLLKSVFAAATFLPLVMGSYKSMAQAYDFTYPDSVVSGAALNNHGFTFHLYDNCSPAPTNYVTAPVSYAVNGMPSVFEVLTGIPLLGIGAPFCPSVTAACTPAGPLNYQKSGGAYTFASKANTTAPGLHSFVTKFGVTGFGNYEAANMAGTFMIEPENFNVVTAGMNNYAPKFINPPVIFANVNQPVSFSTAAIDKDGDSLVYRLRPVHPFAPYATGFTYLNPITASPALALHPRTGIITFTPTAYNATGGPNANKYMVGVEVDEYRKLNGQQTRIGTIQRNIIVNVISNTNNSPTLDAYLNGILMAENTIKEVDPGTFIVMSFVASDPDLTNALSLVTNATSVLPLSFYAPPIHLNPTNSHLHWTPTAADVRDEPYFFNITATDNACPYPASITRTYGIRVRNVTGLKADSKVSARFLAFPNPFTESVNFKIGQLNQPGKIRILNLLGQQLEEIQVPGNAGSEQNIPWQNAGKFAAGTYVANLISEGKTIQTIKFTKLQ